MAKKIKIKPTFKEKKDGRKTEKVFLKVFNPKTGRNIKQEGETVELTTYWERRLKEGEVELVKDKVKKDGD